MTAGLSNFQTYQGKKEKKATSPIKDLMDFCDELRISYSIDDMGDAYARIPIHASYQLYKVQSPEFRNKILYLYFKAREDTPISETLVQMCNILEQKALESNNLKPIYRRIGRNANAIYYDLANHNHKVVKVEAEGYKIITKSKLNFLQVSNTRPQVIPKSGSGSVKYVLKHFRFKEKSDKLLFLVYLISCLIPDIPHPILIFAGDKGAAKSTSMRMLRKIIDPANADLMAIPKSIENLVINLGNNYISCFDNLSHLSDELSNLFCMASTGGTITKRKLYSDSQEIQVNIKRIVTMNGINVVAAKPDLLDRSLLLTLNRIPSDSRKAESTIWREFDDDLPYILDWCFRTLSKAMELFPSTSLPNLPRMADFAAWGFAITEAIGWKGQLFLDAYTDNQKLLSEDVLNFHIVASLCLLFMKKRPNWEGTWTEMYHEFKEVAKSNNIDLQLKDWPRGINHFSRSLSEVKSDLEHVGIFYKVTHGKVKKVSVTNKSYSGDLMEHRRRRQIKK